MAKKKAQPVSREVGLPAALLEKYKDFPGIKAIERRMLTGEETGSVDIRLKGDPTFLEDPLGRKRMWHLRWINTNWPGRWIKVTQQLGYVGVHVSELLDKDAIPELHKKAEDGADPLVRIGEKGQIILAKIPKELYTASKRAQQERRDRRSRNAKIVKEEMATNAARALGDEAADTIHDEFDLTLRRTRSTLGAESAPMSDAEEAEILDRA